MRHWLAEAEWVNGQRLKAYPRIFLALFVVLIVVSLATSDGLVDRRGEPIGTDFVSFWAASSLALDGDAPAAYDVGEHRTAQQLAVSSDDIPYYAWQYPPTFLLVSLPTALLSYGWSLLLWVSLTFLAYLAVIRRIVPESAALWLAAAFPAVFVNLGHGQNGFLTTALMGGGLLLLDRRPVAAGGLIGLLSFKPQLGILIPFVLAATRRWKAFAAAAAAAVGFGAIAFAAFGYDTWAAFVDSAPTARALLEEGGVPWTSVQSAFAAVRMLGGGVGLAYVLQGIVGVAAAIATIWVWRRNVSLPVRSSALVVGTLLATPFLLDYDLMLLALPLAWLGYEGYQSGFLTWEKTTLTLAWITPLIARVINVAASFPLTVLVLITLMALIVRRTLSVLSTKY